MTDIDGDTVSWRELLAETEAALESMAHVEHPRLEAKWIIEDLVDDAGAGFSTALEQPARVRGVARLDSMVRRRRAGEPIQYVLGHWAFRSLDLLVDGRVLIPRPETEVVAGVALDELDRVSGDGTGTVVDLGTGSGAIGLSVAAERPGTRVVLTDTSDDALAVARANTAGLGTAGATVTIHAGSWFDALPAELRGRCDVVVSNPPYVPATARLPESVERWEPGSALRSGPDGLGDLIHLVDGAGPWFRPGGALVIELDPDQVDAVVARADLHGFATEVRPDNAGLDRVLVARAAS